jgi:hypothetical protein
MELQQVDRPFCQPSSICTTSTLSAAPASTSLSRNASLMRASRER